MLHIDNKTHISVIIKSIENIYNQSKIYGQLNIEDINYLNIIYKLLNSCNLDLSVEEINKLTSIYENIQFSSKYICPVLKYPKHVQIKPKFVQAETKDCNNFLISNKLFYWQDSRLTVNITDELSEEILIDNYFNNKLFKTKLEFETGVDIVYTGEHKKCFAISESSITNYIITNITTNEIITDDFDIVLIPLLNMTLLVTNKDFSSETIKIQIKQDI